MSIEVQHDTNASTIKNDQIKLEFEDALYEKRAGSALFKYFNVYYGIEQQIVFEFRKYNSEHSGAYVFATEDKDSYLYEHYLLAAKVYPGQLV